jgi:quinol monooxygenase YgiN
MYVITVEFQVRADKRDAFHAEMVTNARASREREPGCLQFDVCADPAQPERIFLYEVYADRAAFDAHLATAHFKAFDARVAPWLAGKTVRSYARLDPA